jgi:hypothetical protein
VISTAVSVASLAEALKVVVEPGISEFPMLAGTQSIGPLKLSSLKS